MKPPRSSNQGSILILVLVVAAVLSTAVLAISQRRIQDSRAVTRALQRETGLRQVRDRALRLGQELRDLSNTAAPLATKEGQLGCNSSPPAWKVDSAASAAGLEVLCRTVTVSTPKKYFLSVRTLRDPSASPPEVLADATVEVVSLPPSGCALGQSLHYGSCTPQDCRWDIQSMTVNANDDRTTNFSCGAWDYTEYGGDIDDTGGPRVSCTAIKFDDDGPDSTDKLRVTCQNTNNSSKTFNVKLKCCRND